MPFLYTRKVDRQWSHRGSRAVWHFAGTNLKTGREIELKSRARFIKEIPEGDPVPKFAQKQPSVETMTRWMDEGYARATDGCCVEPDGRCEHGKPSWLLQMGLI